MVTSERSCLCGCCDEGGELKVYMYVGGVDLGGMRTSVGYFKYGIMGVERFRMVAF